MNKVSHSKRGSDFGSQYRGFEYAATNLEAAKNSGVQAEISFGKLVMSIIYMGNREKCHFILRL